jgi:hypothetical protein
MGAAETCAAACGTLAYLAPLLAARRGRCRLLDPEAR